MRDDDKTLVPQPGAAPPPPVRAHGSAGEALLFRGLSKAELLARLADGDPLRLYERATRCCRQRALLIDTDRLFDRALVRTAVAGRPGDRASLEAWLGGRVEDAIADLLREDRARLAAGTPVGEGSPYLFAQQLFCLETQRVLSAVVAFNSLAPAVRAAFVALAIETRSVSECVKDGLGPESRLKKHVREALRALTGREPIARTGSANVGESR